MDLLAMYGAGTHGVIAVGSDQQFAVNLIYWHK